MTPQSRLQSPALPQVRSSHCQVFTSYFIAHVTARWSPDCGVPCVPAMQWFVPSVELSAGLGLAFGFLTPLAALGLIAICVVATCTDGLKRIRSWQPLDKADAVDDLLYLPEFIYIILLSFFVAAGAGPLSLDAIINNYL